jgi:hypothetical protein
MRFLNAHNNQLQAGKARDSQKAPAAQQLPRLNHQKEDLHEPGKY